MSAGDPRVPRGVLLAAGAILLLSIVLAGVARHRRSPAAALPAPISVAEVRFADTSDGGIAVIDARSGREITVLPPRSNGFVRGVLRGLFRERRLESIDRDARFRLAREASGRLSLEDPQTGRRIDLDAFGSTNVAAFADLLAVASKSP